MESGLIPVGDAGLWAMVSMSAMMGGTMRSPLKAILFTGRAGIMRARVRLFQEENLRERGGES